MSGRSELPLPWAPSAPVARLTSVVTAASMSRTKTSVLSSVSAGSRFVDDDANATWRPSPEIRDHDELPLPPAPTNPLARLTSRVVSPTVSRTNTSWSDSASPSGSKFDASDSKATWRPSSEMLGAREGPSPLTLSARLTSLVVPACRSRTKTSSVASPSAGSRFVAVDAKAT